LRIHAIVFSQPRQSLILLVTRDNRVALWPRIKEALEGAGVPFDPPKEEGFSGSDVGRLVPAGCLCSRAAQMLPTADAQRH